MNILFFCAFKPASHTGGTERATITVATGLKKYYGWNSYAAYICDDDRPDEACFEEEYQINGDKCIRELEDLINRLKIDCFIDQGDMKIGALIDRRRIPEKTKLFLAYHFEPGWDFRYITKDELKRRYREGSISGKVIAVIKLLLFDVYFRSEAVKNLKKYYHEAYYNMDHIVLLSKGYIGSFSDIAELKDTDRQKFAVIPNALTYDSYYPVEKLGDKKKRVLIVSRLDEVQKRLSLALDIWKRVKQEPVADDWVLDIVGSGSNEPDYKHKVENEHIKDVVFHGRKDPVKYYEDAAIFMMTSKSEGWPLTISEALQFGVVPVVYNTVASFNEMIEDEKTGRLIGDGEEDKYVEAMLSLMADVEYRRNLAKQGIESCKRFETPEIVGKWKELISEAEV